MITTVLDCVSKRLDNRCVPIVPDARAVLAPLLGRTISTVTGKPNTVLALHDDVVLVGTGRSPAGTPVPLAMVQAGLDALFAERFVNVDVPSLGHRSAFVGAVLATVAGASVESTTPPRIVLVPDIDDLYRREAAGSINAWWAPDAGERFWLEITDRPDPGVDLHAPQRDASGRSTYGYSLLWWVERGDVVFHYDLNARAVTAWSRAVGDVVEAPVVWLSHRAATRRRLGEARAQPGWWLDLEGPFPLETPLTLQRLREQADAVRAVLAELEQRYQRPIYFPFFFYGGDQLRPMQPYLNKLPAALVAALPELAVTAAAPATARTQAASARPGSLGAPYRRVEARNLPDDREPFSVDPAVVERGLAGHVDSQNAVADALVAAGLEPRSPRADEPSFDLAWEKDGAVYVAEVKSITDRNEERQLRLGLGQVLRYRWLLGQRHDVVRAALVVEREPRDASWRSLCDDIGVVLITATDARSLLE